MPKPISYLSLIGEESPLEAARSRADEWAQNTEGVMETYLASHQSSGALLRSLKYRVQEWQRAETALRITFKFVRHGAFLEKGARKGYGGTQGSSWTTKNGVKKFTKGESLGKMGTGASPAVPWTKPALDKQLPELADMIAAQYDKDILSTFQSVLIRR